MPADFTTPNQPPQPSQPAAPTPSEQGDNRPANVLILGGTAEARALAAALVAADVPVTSSLAGRVSRPRLPVGDVRIGGFGGVEGLVRYLREHAITHIVDATHPFAVGMRRHAVDAAQRTQVPAVRLARPGWHQHPNARAWYWADDYRHARTIAEQLGQRPFLTSGRQTLQHFTSWDTDALVRVVEPLDFDVPERWQVKLSRGPFSYDDEVALMREHGTDVLVTKDSGGTFTASKLDAARDLGIPVVIVRRPSAPAGLTELSDADDVLRWVGCSTTDG